MAKVAHHREMACLVSPDIFSKEEHSIWQYLWVYRSLRFIHVLYILRVI